MIKRILIIVAVVVLIIVAIIGIVNLINYADFIDNKKTAYKYVEDNYDFDFELISEKMGKSSYPAPRTDDFVFYDKTNKLYFELQSYGKSIFDFYEEATPEKIMLP